MKFKGFKILSSIFKYFLLPLLIGWCIPTFTSFTEGYSFFGIDKIGFVTKNFQYNFSVGKAIAIGIVGVLLYAIESILWKNKKSINLKYINIGKIYFIFISFFVGMNIEFSYKQVVFWFDKGIKLIDYFANSKSIPLLSLIIFFYAPIYLIVYFIYEEKIKSFIRRKKYLRKKNKLKVESINVKKVLVSSRNRQKKTLINALASSNRILVTAEWGVGKTTFVDIVLSQFSDKYHKIYIDVLVFNDRERIKNEFLNQIKGILKVENIYFKNINEYLGFIDNVGSMWSKFIKNAFYENESFEGSKKSLKIDLENLNKDIVIVFDNLERIIEETFEKSKTIKEIIGFIHEIGNLDRVKTIIIADYEKLVNDDDKSKKENHIEYLDKFYDYQINIKSCPLEELIEAKENEEDKDVELLKEISHVAYDIIYTEFKYRGFDKNQEEEDKRVIEKIKNEINSAICLPRTVEKIVFVYKALKGTDTENNGYELIQCSIFMVLYFDKWNSAIVFENIKRIPEVQVIFKNKRFSNGEIKERTLFDNDFSSIEKILFYEKEKTMQAKNFVDNFSDTIHLDKHKMGNYFENLEIYYKFYDKSKAREIYKKIIIILSSWIKNKNITDGQFIRIINSSFVWQMEYELHTESKGDIIAIIEENKINSYNECKGIDFYILKSFSEIFEIFFNLVTNDFEYDFSNKFSFYNKKEEKADYFFPNYNTLAEELKKIKSMTDKDNSITYVKRIMNDILNKKELDDSILKNKFKIMFERMECFISMTKGLYKTNKKTDWQMYDERLIELRKINDIDKLIQHFSISFISSDDLQQQQLIKIYSEHLNAKTLSDIQKLKIKAILSYIDKTINIRKLRKEMDKAIFNVDAKGFYKKYEEFKLAFGKENPIIDSDTKGKFEHIYSTWKETEEAKKNDEITKFKENIEVLKKMEINQDKVKELEKKEVPCT